LQTHVAYTYDAEGALASVKSGEDEVQYSYTPKTRNIAELRYAHRNQVMQQIERRYDGLNRLQSLLAVGPNALATPAGADQILRYTYDKSDRRTATEHPNGTSWSYDYDSMGRLVRAKQQLRNQTKPTEFTYAYDRFQNLLRYECDDTSTAIVQQRTYDIANQCTSSWQLEEGKTSTPLPQLKYDVYGNLLSDASWTYAWDAEGRLTRMESQSATAPTQIDFAYDWLGRRVEKAVRVRQGDIWSLQSSVRFVYDGWKPVAEFGADGSLLKSFVWGLDTTGRLDGGDGSGGLLIVHDATSGSGVFVVSDANGNTWSTLDTATARRTATVDYSPFGSIIGGDDATPTIPFSWGQKYLDRETGLVYYGFRYYSPSQGRFISRDPLSDPVSPGQFPENRRLMKLARAFKERLGPSLDLNPYVFADNDPINKTDLYGLAPCTTAQVSACAGKCRTSYPGAVTITQCCVHKVHLLICCLQVVSCNCQCWCMYLGTALHPGDPSTRDCYYDCTGFGLRTGYIPAGSTCPGSVAGWTYLRCSNL
jgi:RHS repeat-associated protein